MHLNIQQVAAHLSRGVYSQHAVVGGACITLLVVVAGDELVVVLPPRENVTPVAQLVRHNRQSVAPRLHDGLHVVQGGGPAVQKTLVDLGSLLQLHDLRKHITKDGNTTYS